MNEIKELTGGRMELQWFDGGAVIGNPEMLEAIGSGIMEMGVTVGAYQTGIIPELDVESGLLFSFRSPLDVHYFFYEEPWRFVDFVCESYAPYNIYYAGYQSINPRGWYTKFPVRTLDDWKGRKIRAYGKLIDYLTVLGAEAVYVTIPEVYTGLATGVFEGCTMGPAKGWLDVKLYETGCKYISLPYPEAAAQQSVIINSDAWNTLPDDLKAILEIWIQRTAYEYAVTYVMVDELAQNTLVNDHGSEIIRLSDADVRRSTEIAHDIWNQVAEKSPRAAEAIELLRDFMRYRGYMD